MTIPRGYIPGKTDFPVITSASGSISFDNDNLQTSGTISCNGLVSPEVKALLDSHDYQYVYDWSLLPQYSNHKWSASQVQTTIPSISGGIFQVRDTTSGSEYANYRREQSNINKDDIIIAEHKLNPLSSTGYYALGIMSITENYEYSTGLYHSISVGWYNDYLYVDSVPVCSWPAGTIGTVKVIKNGTNKTYVFFNDELILTRNYDDLYGTTSTWMAYGLFFGTSTARASSTSSTSSFDSYSFKYSKLQEGAKEINGTSSKIVGGNVDVKNQAETQGMQLTSSKLLATGTNQNVELEANGTGEVVLNSNLSGKAIKGAIQHKYSGLISANYVIPSDVGFILTQTVSGNIDIDLPDAANNFGRTIIVNTNSSLNQTTVTCVDPNDRIYYNGVITYTTVTLAGFPKYVQLTAMNNNCWQVTSHYGATFS